MSNIYGPVCWSPGMTIDALEEQVIKKALAHYKTKTVTADSLGIAPRTLDYKLAKYAEEAKIQEALYDADQRKRAELLARARGITYIPPAGVETKPVIGVVSESIVPLPEPQDVHQVLPAQITSLRTRRAR